MEASSSENGVARRVMHGRAWSAEAVQESFFGPPQTYVEANGCRLAYRVFGEGPDVVFIHGWPLHSATFREMVPVLAQHFRCHLLDLPGAGQSREAPRERISVKVHVETMRAALTRLRIERYALVAHDSGGVIARMLAAEDQRATALVFGGSEIPGHHPNLLKVFLWAARLRLDAAVLSSMALPVVQRSRLGFGGAFHDLRHAQGAMASQFAGESEFVALSEGSLFVQEECAREFAERTHAFLLRRLILESATARAT